MYHETSPARETGSQGRGNEGAIHASLWGGDYAPFDGARATGGGLLAPGRRGLPPVYTQPRHTVERWRRQGGRQVLAAACWQGKHREAARLRGKQRGLGGSLGGGERAEPPPQGGGGGGGGDPESRAPGMGRGYWQWERGGVTRRRWVRQRRGGVEPPPPAVVPVRTKPCAIEIGGGSAGAVLLCAKPLACRSM